MSSLLYTRLALFSALALAFVSVAGAEAPLFLVDSTFASEQTTISVLDPATGSMQLVADLGDEFTPVFGLAAASGRILYLTGTDTSSADTCLGLRSCLLLRVELAPNSLTPMNMTIVGPVRTNSGVVTEIIGLAFRSDGTLVATSQETDSIYEVDSRNGHARLIGNADLDLHGAGVTQNQDGQTWLWSNIGSASGLYLVDPLSATASAFQLYPGIYIAGLAAVNHEGWLYASQPATDRLLAFNSVTGLQEADLPLTLNGQPFDHSRGDMDSPFCADDAACDDGDPATADRCLPGGCRSISVVDIETICPCDGPGRPWKNHGEYVSCVARAGSRLRSGGRSLVSDAARSSCGIGRPDPDLDYTAQRPGRGRR